MTAEQVGLFGALTAAAAHYAPDIADAVVRRSSTYIWRSMLELYCYINGPTLPEGEQERRRTDGIAIDPDVIAQTIGGYKGDK
eukprot:gene14147-11801_t